jgi:uncharacterized repeat protein (TIGR01451 family)
MRKSFTITFAALIALMMVQGLFVLAPAYASPQNIDVTVTIIRFIQDQDPDPGPFQGDGDYYAKVRIHTFGYQTTSEIDDDPDISPYWTFTRTVDMADSPISIVIQILDDDVWPATPDDIMDINPTDAVQELVILLDLTTGTWSGDVPANVGWSQGDGDREHFGFTEGGEKGRILFDIALSSNGDIDGDGIPDGVERFGIRDANGNLVADMAALGADPCRKTIAVEIDYMILDLNADGDGDDPGEHSHRPMAAAITQAIEAFEDNAPDTTVPSPYPGFPSGTGVNLIVDVDDAIPEVNPLGFGAGFAGIKSANFHPDRRRYFHYNLWIHNRPGTTSSGVAEVSGNDFMVSLGSFTNQVGSLAEQTGTFIHELGHNLGLGHGGGDGVNRKPNYLSVMSYNFQMSGVLTQAVDTNGDGIPDPTIDLNGDGILDVSSRWDYSHQALPDLDETALNENIGISDGTDFTMWCDLAGNRRAGQGNGPLDWTGNDFDGNGVSDDDAGVQVDINCGDGTHGTLTGFDDWSAVQYVLRDTTYFSDGAGHGPVPTDLTFEEAQLIKQFWLDFFSPDLSVTKVVDLADAIPADTLTYTVTVENIGTGPATAIELTDTFPDGTTETRMLDDLGPSDSTTETFSYVVPFPIADKTVLTNTATVKGEDLQGLPDEDPSNNVATASTVVHTPVLDLSKSATPSVNAGEAITYTMTYENTGSTDATVVITDTLPTDVYYSHALDQGVGPAPDAVTGNLDGTTTLTWLVGNVPSGSGVMTIEYTARPSLLLFAGESVSNDATLDFTDANANDYPELTASATTDITSVPPGQDPKSLGFVRNHDEFWSDEILARIQATDQRFDGADGTIPDGLLSASEVEAVMRPGGNQPKVLLMQLLTTYFNLATRQINADTAIESPAADLLGLANVRDAVEYAKDTLELPVNKFNRHRYSDATLVLDEINNNLSEVY